MNTDAPESTDVAGPRPEVRLQAGRDKRMRLGHPWIFSNEILAGDSVKALPPGGLVRLIAADGACLGVATFNPHTLIAARRLTREGTVAIDRAFFAKHLRRALALRSRLYDRPFYRLIHAEADGLPALVVDRFGDAVVVQANSAGMDRLLPELTAALDSVLAPRVIVLRNDSPMRALEGLPEETKLLKGELNGPLVVEENGASFFADPLAGQKTGWFYDQRDNRAFIARLCGGARVLDLYTYHGGFAVQAAMAGADRVEAVDRSEPALAHAGRAAEFNGVAAKCGFRRAESFAELERLAAAGERYDVVIADPPPFARAKKDVAAASRAYRKLSRMAARVTTRGGVMLIASCSHNIDPGSFTDLVAGGLSDAERSGRILRQAGAGPDHPIHPMLPESAYLKAVVVQVD
ncbi:MAG: class I SAM-dependent rRNA methyltransferase [Rhodospirillaceae bacterium]